MNRRARIIIAVLAILLICSIILNVSMLVGKVPGNSECNKVNSELIKGQDTIQSQDTVQGKDSVIIK